MEVGLEDREVGMAGKLGHCEVQDLVSEFLASQLVTFLSHTLRVTFTEPGYYPRDNLGASPTTL